MHSESREEKVSERFRELSSKPFLCYFGKESGCVLLHAENLNEAEFKSHELNCWAEARQHGIYGYCLLYLVRSIVRSQTRKM